MSCHRLAIVIRPLSPPPGACGEPSGTSVAHDAAPVDAEVCAGDRGETRYLRAEGSVHASVIELFRRAGGPRSASNSAPAPVVTCGRFINDVEVLIIPLSSFTNVLNLHAGVGKGAPRRPPWGAR